MTTDVITQPPTAEYLAAESAFRTQVDSVRVGIDVLFPAWQRWRTASARRAVDPLADITFASVVDAVIDSRVSGHPFVLPTTATRTPTPPTSRSTAR